MKSGPEKKMPTDEQKNWVHEFLNRPDISYTTPGRNDNVYMGKVNGERQYQQKQYLLWTLRELFEIVNGCTQISHLNSSECFESKFNVKLTFCQLYDFIKVNKYYILINKFHILHASARFARFARFAKMQCSWQKVLTVV